jgi:putative N-acetyltransferase (TIGR04045 family)
MIIETILPFMPCEFRIKFAASRWEREGSYALRRAVFCKEQPIFHDDDCDATDEYAILIVALSMLVVASDRVVGVGPRSRRLAHS